MYMRNRSGPRILCVCIVQESYTPKPTVKMLQHIADYRSLLDPVVEELHLHSQPWCFRFTHNKITCRAEMHYKYRSPDACMDTKWSRSACSSESIACFYHRTVMKYSLCIVLAI